MVSSNKQQQGKRPNIGVIGIRGAWSTEVLSEHLKDKKAGGAVLELREICYDAGETRFSHRQYEIDDFDGFIIKKMGARYSSQLLDELELLALMENKGFIFFSSPHSLRKMISRLSCTIHLRTNNITMPPTYITEDIDHAIDWLEKNGPAILKPLYSTKARGMVLLERSKSPRKVLENFINAGEKIIYLQKKLDLSGSDYGLFFLGGNYIGAYARVGDGSTWHTTTEQGGRYLPFQPPQDYIDLAQRAQAPFDLDFTCVDVANSKEMGPIVFEVSAFGGFNGMSMSSGVDVADMVSDYAIARFTAKKKRY